MTSMTVAERLVSAIPAEGEELCPDCILRDWPGLRQRVLLRRAAYRRAAADALDNEQMGLPSNEQNTPASERIILECLLPRALGHCSTGEGDNRV